MLHEVMKVPLNLALEKLLYVILGARFLSNLGSLIVGIFSTVKYLSTENASADTLATLLFMFFAGSTLNDLSSLPVNVYYLWSTLNKIDLTDKWAQALAFGSPIVSATVFILGTLISAVLIGDDLK